MLIENQPVTLHEAKPEDNGFIGELSRLTALEVVDRYPWEDDEQRRRVLTQYESARIVQVGANNVGVFQVVYSPQQVHLSHIRFLPGWQGKGLGTTLIKVLQDLCARTGTSITLHVSKSNRALKLYRRLGFEISKADELSYLMKWNPPNGNSSTG